MGLRRPLLYISQILAWADAHRERTGTWPKKDTPGIIAGTLDEKWLNVDHALRKGLRGLVAGSSLARLLAEQRGVRNHMDLPPLTVSQILAWADAHHERTGTWPKKDTPGVIADTLDENWLKVDDALRQGKRGFEAGSSLARLLAEHRGVRNHWDLPPLSVRQIMGWVSDHFQRTGNWPTRDSGGLVEAPSETWLAIDGALRDGLRGLPGGSSLARLLFAWHKVRNCADLPPLTEAQILRWADAHFQRTHTWPKKSSGPVLDAPGETWMAIQSALTNGQRGLEGGSSLAQLLAQERHVPNPKERPPLTVKQILIWMEAHYLRTGAWPTRRSGPILNGGETWASVNSALRDGYRGLPGASSLARLLRKHYGVPLPQDRPGLHQE